LDTDRLRDRGVMSLGINNAGAYVPIRAHTFGDPQIKFHSAQFMDGNVLSFVPFGKLFYDIQIKHRGTFCPTKIRSIDCPATFGFSRQTDYEPDKFLSTPYAMWGCGHEEAKKRNTYRRLCTVLLGIRLLHYLGCPRIYLLGVDHHIAERDSGTPGYAWGDNASSGNRIWWKIDTYYNEIRPVCEAAGLNIYNCNPTSKCESFEYSSYRDALADCKGPIEEEPLDVHNWYNKKLSAEHHARFAGPLDLERITELRAAERGRQWLLS